VDIEHRQLVQLLPILPLLAELGRTQHITETAELLGVPQSTVSRALARASAVVGTELLVRDGRGVRLTPAATTLLPYVESALAEFRAGLDLVRHESEVVRGRVAVTFQHTFGEATLPLLISAFRSRYPQTEFDLRQGSRDSCLAELSSGAADLALTAPVAPASRAIGSAALYREPLRLVVHHRHPAGRPEIGGPGRDPERSRSLRSDPATGCAPWRRPCSGRPASGRGSPLKARIHTPRVVWCLPGWESASSLRREAAGRASASRRAPATWAGSKLGWNRNWRTARSAWPGGSAAACGRANLMQSGSSRELVLEEGPGLLAGLVRARSGA
jgi:DNA-binding transcriptional LysR family regulator